MRVSEPIPSSGRTAWEDQVRRPSGLIGPVEAVAFRLRARIPEGKAYQEAPPIGGKPGTRKFLMIEGEEGPYLPDSAVAEIFRLADLWAVESWRVVGEWIGGDGAPLPKSMGGKRIEYCVGLSWSPQKLTGERRVVEEVRDIGRIFDTEVDGCGIRAAWAVNGTRPEKRNQRVETLERMEGMGGRSMDEALGIVGDGIDAAPGEGDDAAWELPPEAPAPGGGGGRPPGAFHRPGIDIREPRRPGGRREAPEPPDMDEVSRAARVAAVGSLPHLQEAAEAGDRGAAAAIVAAREGPAMLERVQTNWALVEVHRSDMALAAVQSQEATKTISALLNRVNEAERNTVRMSGIIANLAGDVFKSQKEAETRHFEAIKKAEESKAEAEIMAAMIQMQKDAPTGDGGIEGTAMRMFERIVLAKMVGSKNEKQKPPAPPAAASAPSNPAPAVAPAPAASIADQVRQAIKEGRTPDLIAALRGLPEEDQAALMGAFLGS